MVLDSARGGTTLRKLQKVKVLFQIVSTMKTQNTTVDPNVEAQWLQDVVIQYKKEKFERSVYVHVTFRFYFNCLTTRIVEQEIF